MGECAEEAERKGVNQQGEQAVDRACCTRQSQRQQTMQHLFEAAFLLDARSHAVNVRTKPALEEEA